MLLKQQHALSGFRHGRRGGEPAVARADDDRVIRVFQESNTPFQFDNARDHIERIDRTAKLDKMIVAWPPTKSYLELSTNTRRF
ncbi:hypothetical protein SDC9_143402 [bioreactor metagenome]|uniref:Uncharacterized protein n=1 Tax=bioreactor metagenome TaxID=1076179 RepID=A0A645E371_9ZZZZ